MNIQTLPEAGDWGWGEEKQMGPGGAWDPGYEDFDKDPVLGLPKQPIQSATIDPGQWTFEFPFQWPGQNPGQVEPQPSPADVPDDQLQDLIGQGGQVPEPQPTDEEAPDSILEMFDPRQSLVANAWEMGKSIAEESGMELGVLGEINLNESLLGNALRIASDDIKSALSQGFEMPDLMMGAAGGGGMGSAMNLEEFDQLTKSIEEAGVQFDTPAAESPVATQTESISNQGIDLASTEVATGQVPEMVGADVLPGAEEGLAAKGIDLATSAVSEGKIVEMVGADVLPTAKELFSVLGLGI